MKNNHYVYALLDPEESSKWNYEDVILSNKPFYIGIGVGKRCNAHTSKSNLNKEVNLIKKNKILSIQNKGNKIVIFKIYENISHQEAKIKEISIIKHFGKLIDKSGFLTNISNGGDTTNANVLGKENIHSKTVYQYGNKGNFIKKWECLRCITRELSIKINYNTIGDCCRANEKNNGTSYSAGGFMWFYEYKGNKIPPYSFENGQSKIVYKYCIRNLSLLDVYSSALEGAQSINADKSAVSKSCLKKIKIQFYVFSYEPMSLTDLKKIQNKYLYYNFEKNNTSHVCFSLKEVADIIQIEYKKLKYLNDCNKLPNLIRKNIPNNSKQI